MAAHQKPRRETKKKGRSFWPRKYYAGLSKTAKRERRKEIKTGSALSWRNPKAYVGFKTDRLAKSKPSNYTKRFRAMFPRASSLKQKAEATGVPTHVLRKSYNRGLAAWRTGHRPGATAQQWGYARVHSLLVCGKTAKTTDADLVRKARRTSKRANQWFRKVCG